jgi:UDP-glucose 4-epimerase
VQDQHAKPIRSLVTGGCGFIGSHLADLLLQQGHEVVVLDNMSTGRRANLDHLDSNAHLTIIEGSVQDEQSVQKAMEGCDYVFHLAALADIVPSIVNPLGYFSANVDGTVIVLDVARRLGIKKLVYTASSSCYGIPDTYPTPENAEIQPQYPYAFTKWAGEQTALHWSQVYGLPVVALRLFNVYGPRSRTSGTYGAVFGVFLAQKLAGAPMTVVGDGTQTRDFTYVTDVSRAFLAAALTGVSGQSFNVGSGGTYSINSLVEMLGGPFSHIPKRPGEPDCTFADTTRIKAELGWAPEVTFDKGVGLMLEHIEYWREAPVWNPESIAEATTEWFTYLGDKP